MSAVTEALKAWREAERRLQERERAGDEEGVVAAVADVLIAQREYQEAFERAVEKEREEWR